MCTVTVIPMPNRGLRLVSNRDEQRTRPASSLPKIHALRDNHQGAWPIDPTGGGTWIGVGTQGLAMSLLNLNLDPHPTLPDNPVSRGTVIPHVINERSAKEASERITDLALERMNCFRLVMADADRVLCARWDREELTISERPLAPICFASSGLGDHLVQTRLPLWDEMIEAKGVSAETQDAFHAHAWPDRGLESVLMTREAARTTSTTVTEVSADRVTIAHRDDEGWHEPLHLERRAEHQSEHQAGAPSAR